MKEAVSNQIPATNKVMIVRSHDAVDLLLNVQAAKHLAPFMRCEQSLGSASVELDRRPSSVAYWVGRFVQAGLLVVTREQARAGKAIPYYRAAADEFQIPFDAMSPGVAEEFLHGARNVMVKEFATSVERAARKHFTDGITVTGHPQRGMSISFIEPTRDGSTSPVTEWWGKVSLSKAEAGELQKEMEALVSRFSSDVPGRGKSPYLIMVGITPTIRR
ncbi:MAG: hypothetical protein K8R99_11035 [Actinomycetia bacterium]|nr:hypothetical protein [Actinomycetes bacterium]